MNLTLSSSDATQHSSSKLGSAFAAPSVLCYLCEINFLVYFVYLDVNCKE